MSEFLKKEVEADDPMELHGIQFYGDPGYMIDCVVEEYARIGWSRDQILELFESPDYPVLRALLESRGKDAIIRSIERVMARCGIFRSRTVEAPEELELVMIEPLADCGSSPLSPATQAKAPAPPSDRNNLQRLEGHAFSLPDFCHRLLREGGQRDESGL